VDPEWKTWSDDVPRYLKGLQHPRAVEGFLRDMSALRSCDVCVMVMPCGPSASMEMGWATGAGKLVLVYMPAIREPDLMVKMADCVTDNFAEIRSCVYQHYAQLRSREQRDISSWFDRNKGSCDTHASVCRASTEMVELLVAAKSGNVEAVREEAADVAICLYLTAEKAGFDLQDAVRWKHSINESRKWYVDDLGCLHHVKGSDPREKEPV
jgi:NTP pyrophosphatase (non-canonical NTP hydrolase)